FGEPDHNAAAVPPARLLGERSGAAHTIKDQFRLSTVDYDLPLGAVAPYDPGHPMLRDISPALLETSTANGTIAMLLNAGALFREVCRLSREALHPIFGSSAN